MANCIASEMDNIGENEVHPRFTSIDNVYCGLTANNGTANIYGSVNGKVGQVTKGCNPRMSERSPQRSVLCPSVRSYP